MDVALEVGIGRGFSTKLSLKELVSKKVIKALQILREGTIGIFISDFIFTGCCFLSPFCISPIAQIITCIV
jgi:hypothetical protein